MQGSRGSRFKKFWDSRIFNILLIVIIIFVGVSTYKTVRDAVLVHKERNNAEDRIKELDKKKTELETYLLELETSAVAEREAKERLQMKIHGEEVVVVVPEKNKEEKGTTTPVSWWKRIKNIFNGNK